MNPSISGKGCNSFLFLSADAQFASDAFRVSSRRSTDGSKVCDDLFLHIEEQDNTDLEGKIHDL